MFNLYEEIINKLKSNKILYVEHRHKAVFTSEQAALTRGTKLSEGAKALIFQADNQIVQIVLPGDKKVDKSKVKNLLKYTKFKMVSAEEVEKISGVKPGAVPPFGNLFPTPIKIICSKTLTQNDEIEFNAGHHEISVRMKTADWLNLTNPIILDIDEKPLTHKLLGIDYGTKKIGLALGTISETGNHYGKLKILRNTPNHQLEQEALNEIGQIIEQENISIVVIGLPLLNGKETKQTKEIRSFGKKLRKLIKPHIKIEYVDETHTTKESATELTRQGYKKSKLYLDDSEAAAQILNRFMEL